MRLFLDTEFNQLRGELISMALVSEDGKSEWYEVRAIPERPGEWVAEHVLPKLGKDPIGGDVPFAESLREFLSRFNGCEIIADWPADFEHLCHYMTWIASDNDFRLTTECSMRLINSGEFTPDNPHNALSDARALRDWFRRQAQKSVDEWRNLPQETRHAILGIGY